MLFCAMPMTPFIQRFPELGTQVTRTIITAGSARPAGGRIRRSGRKSFRTQLRTQKKRVLLAPPPAILEHVLLKLNIHKERFYGG